MRRRQPIILAVDLGTSSVRTALFDDTGQPIPGSSASRLYQVRYTHGQGAELDPATLLRAARAALRQTLRHTKDVPRTISGSGFWHSLLGIDAAGEPLTPIYTWADARGREDAALLRAEFDEYEIQQRTGCMLRASFWPAKLRWLQRTQPGLFRRVSRWVSPAEWIFAKVWKTDASSHSMASATGLYDLRRRDWDEQLLVACGLTRAQVGKLCDAVAREDSMVLPAIGDGAAGNLGSGATRSGIVAINVGTSAAVRAVAPVEGDLPFGLFRFVIDSRRTLLGGAVSNAGNLRAWARRELRLPARERDLEKVLSRTNAGAEDLTILPFWAGERAPTWPENIPGAVIGFSQTTTATDLAVAALTAVNYRLAQILELLETSIGRAKKIIVSGGILQSPASLQLLADSLGHDLEICSEREASLRGAAIYALEKLGQTVVRPKCGRRIQHQRVRTKRARQQRARQEALENLLSGWNQSVG
jgi:gluconokinase